MAKRKKTVMRRQHDDWGYWFEEYRWACDSVSDLHRGVGELLALDFDCIGENVVGLEELRAVTKRMLALAQFARLVGLSDRDGGGQLEPMCESEKVAASKHWHQRFSRALKVADR